MPNSQHRWRARATWVLLALACAALPAAAQVFTGRIDVTVQDSTGAVLPGVTVEISGPQQQTTITDAQGQVHLLNLPAGTYTGEGVAPGVCRIPEPDRAGRRRQRDSAARHARRARRDRAGAGRRGHADHRAQAPDDSTNITNQELQNIPTARDPWVVLQTVPGVIVDRVNVGGAESGQQSNYIAKGATTGDNTWNMDGIPITDMARWDRRRATTTSTCSRRCR